MLKLKLQYFGHWMQADDSLEKSELLGKTECRRRGHQRMRWLDGIIDAMDMNLGKLQEIVRHRGLVCCSPGGHKDSDLTGWLNNSMLSWPAWTKTIYIKIYSKTIILSEKHQVEKHQGINHLSPHYAVITNNLKFQCHCNNKVYISFMSHINCQSLVILWDTSSILSPWLK